MLPLLLCWCCWCCCCCYYYHQSAPPPPPLLLPYLIGHGHDSPAPGGLEVVRAHRLTPTTHTHRPCHDHSSPFTAHRPPTHTRGRPSAKVGPIQPYTHALCLPPHLQRASGCYARPYASMPLISVSAIPLLCLSSLCCMPLTSVSAIRLLCLSSSYLQRRPERVELGLHAQDLRVLLPAALLQLRDHHLRLVAAAGTHKRGRMRGVTLSTSQLTRETGG